MFLSHIWLIPLLPAFGAAVMFFFGRKLQKASVSAVCVGTIVLAFLMACGAVWQYSAWSSTPENLHKPYETVLYTWLGTGTGHTNYVMQDGTSAAFQCRRRLPARSAFQHLAAVRHRRRHADPHLFHGIHGA